MKYPEKVMILLLRLCGVLLLTAIIPAVMPFAWMQDIHRWLGMGELPTGPIVDYLTRSLSAMYALHGALILFVTVDIRRYLPIVQCLAALAILFGIGLLVLDFAVDMPFYWAVCEGPFVIVLGAVLLWIARDMQRNWADESADN